jgi:hypothetical protein
MKKHYVTCPNTMRVLGREREATLAEVKERLLLKGRRGKKEIMLQCKRRTKFRPYPIQAGDDNHPIP